MSGDTFSISRGIWDDPQFPDEPFSEREAWMWLIGKAMWKARKFRVGRHVFDLKRGQYAAATRGLAEVWGWKHGKVRRFLDKITADGNIGTLATHGATIITICNYDSYQFTPKSENTQTDTLPARSRHNTEEGNNTLTNVSDIADVRDLLWRDGLNSLKRQTGQPERTCRSLIGKWLKAANNDCAKVLTAINQSEADRTFDPVAWITKAVEPQQLSTFKRWGGI